MERDAEFRRSLTAAGLASTALLAPVRIASGPTPLEQTLDLLWVMIGLSVAGAIITFGFLIYALWKFRDPRTKGRRYG